MESFHRRLGHVRRRLFLQQLLNRVLNGLAAGALLSLGVVVLTRFFPVLDDAGPAVALILAASIVAALLRTILLRPSLVDTGLAIDQRLNLGERITTSLALQGQAGEMVEAVHRDARMHLDALVPSRDFRLLPNRMLRYAASLLFILGAAYLFFPELDLLGQREREAQAALTQQTRSAKAQALKEAAEIIRPNEERADAALESAAGELELLAEQLREGQLSAKQALARVSKVSQGLEQEQMRLAPAALPKTPQSGSQSPARQLREAMAKGDAAKAADATKRLMEKLQDKSLAPEEKESLAKELQELAKEMKGQDGAESSLSEALQNAADALQNQAGDASLNAALSQTSTREDSLSSENDTSTDVANMALQDLASTLEQLAKLDRAQARLGEWKRAEMGPSKNCRSCGRKLEACNKPGNCKGGECGDGHECAGVCKGGGQCSGSGAGLSLAVRAIAIPRYGSGGGMNGPGQGAGNMVGEIPDTPANFEPTILGGETAEGKLLANIMQRTAPEMGDEATTATVEGAFVELRQQAEEALSQEEIPAGSKEFVRQYFHTMAPSDGS